MCPSLPCALIRFAQIIHAIDDEIFVWQLSGGFRSDHEQLFHNPVR